MPLHDIQNAIALIEKGEAGEAAVLLKPMVNEMPAYAAARVLLARAYEAQNHWDLALSLWREALHLIPNSPIVRRGVKRAASHVAADRAENDAAPHASSSPYPPASPSHEDGGERQGADTNEAADSHDAASKYDDLDRLISDLEAARIVPRPDLDNIPSPELEDDIEDVVSETLARIYASQGQYDEAARVYELLAGQHPDDATDFLQKASRMRSRASDGE